MKKHASGGRPGMNKKLKPGLYWIARNRPKWTGSLFVAVRTGRKPSGAWIPAVLVPLTGIAASDHIEAQAAEFEEHGIRVQLRLIAGRPPSPGSGGQVTNPPCDRDSPQPPAYPEANAPKGDIPLRLTLNRAHQMALMSVILEHANLKDSTLEFIDRSQNPPLRTTLADLFNILDRARPA